MSYTLILDPSAVISGRAEFNLNSGPIQADHAGVDWGEAAVSQYMAEQRYGQTPVTYRIPNRVVTIPLLVGANPVGTILEGEEARRKLNEKVALIQRQGGVLLRQREGAIVNLVSNPNLEHDELGSAPGGGWEKGGSTTFEVTKAWAKSGNHSLKIGTPTLGAAGQVSVFFTGETKSIPVVAGDKVAVQGAVNVINIVGPQISVSIEVWWFDASEKFMSAVRFGVKENLGEESISGVATAPVGAAFVKSSYSFTTTPGGASMVAYVDKVMVAIAPVVGEYVDGDVPGYYWTGTPGESTTGAGSGPLYADIVNATLTIPDIYGETGGVEPGVTLKLECLPDFYGEEIKLEKVEGTGQIVAVLREKTTRLPAVIEGDYPARTSIGIYDASGGHDQRSLIWGFNSTHFDTAEPPTNALSFEAAKLTPINGAEVRGNLIYIEEAGDFWHPIMLTDLASTKEPLSHVGSYRVWARCSGAGLKVRLGWSSNDATEVTFNPVVTTPNVSPNDFILDLGEIRIDQSPVGAEHYWRGTLQVMAAPNPEFDIEKLWLQPLDDGAGKLRATAIPSSTLLSPSRQGKKAENTASLGETNPWSNPESVTEGTRLAHVELVNLHKSEGLVVKECGFSIQSGSTIMGIEVKISGESPEAFITPYLNNSGTFSEGAGQVLSGSRTLIFGGPSSLWGTTWTPTQINAAGFGAAVVAQGPPNARNVTHIFSITITVYYSYSSSAITEDAVIYSDRLVEVLSQGAYRADPSTAAYARVTEETGDLPRLPPSGLEGRPVQLFVKTSRGLLPGPNGEPGESDAGVDAMIAYVSYRPCYLGRI